MSVIVAESFDAALTRIYAALREIGRCDVYVEKAHLGYECALKVKPGESDQDFRRFWRRLRNLQPFDVAVKPWPRWELRDFWLQNADLWPDQAAAERDQIRRGHGASV